MNEEMNPESIRKLYYSLLLTMARNRDTVFEKKNNAYRPKINMFVLSRELYYSESPLDGITSFGNRFNRFCRYNRLSFLYDINAKYLSNLSSEDDRKHLYKAMVNLHHVIDTVAFYMSARDRAMKIRNLLKANFRIMCPGENVEHVMREFLSRKKGGKNNETAGKQSHN